MTDERQEEGQPSQFQALAGADPFFPQFFRSNLENEFIPSALLDRLDAPVSCISANFRSIKPIDLHEGYLDFVTPAQLAFAVGFESSRGEERSEERTIYRAETRREREKRWNF